MGGKPGGGLLLGGLVRGGTWCLTGLGPEGGGGVWEVEEDRGLGSVGGGGGTRKAVCLGWGGKGRVRELWRGGLGLLRGIGSLGGGEERTGAAVVNNVCV
ncbi:unnamed protein product [Arctogadus glacialis]